MVVVLSAYACAATNVYYVSSSAGNDSNNGTSAGAPWQTLQNIKNGTFAAGDRILLARGDVWHEALIPPSSGSSGAPIVFDAYGSGAAPEISGYQALSGWTSAGTNQWKVTLTASAVNYVLFGTIWGAKQASQSAVQHDRDFYFSGGLLYVYAPSDPGTYYGSVTAMLMTGTSLVAVNGRSYLTFQHMKVDWFDFYGVSVTGASDHLVFANMEVDGMIPAGALPQGFYFNASNPGDISLINDAFHMNYDGIRVDGTASNITVVNCAGYANRDSALADNTGGHVTYSYSHFYANGTGGIESTDVQGAVELGGAGNGHNLRGDTAPSVEGFARYPARFSFTVDDVGLSAGSDMFVDALIPVFDARGLKMNAAVVTGPTGVSYSVSDAASWVASGHEVDSHSWSHQYFTDPQMAHGFNNTNPTAATAFTIQYTGQGTAATATLTGSSFTTSVTGGPGGENISLTLPAPPNDIVGWLTTHITGPYSVTTSTAPLMRTAAHLATLATFNAANIKTAYAVLYNATGLMADEATASRDWLQGNVAGLSNVKVYVYPDGVTDPAFEAAVAAAGYEGARGTLAMCVSGMSPCAGANGFVSYATGVNAQNIMSLTPAGWASFTRAQLDAKVAALIFKMRVWGYPVGLFVHNTDYTDNSTAATKTGWLLDSIKAHGGTVSRTDALIEAVLAMKPISGTTKYVSAADAGLDLRPKAGAPGVGWGVNQGTTYGKDLAGASRPTSGAWDIGAYQILWTKHGAASGGGHFTMGANNSSVAGENAYCGPGDVALFGSTDGPASLPQMCVHTALAGTPSPGTVRTATSCADFTSKLAAMANNSGDTIVLPASLGKCTGYWTVNYSGDANHWLTIRTDQISNPNFPAEGVRVTPCQIGVTHIDGYPDYACANPADLMPTLSSNMANKSVLTFSGDHVRVIGLEISKESGVSMANSLMELGQSDHVILDRVLVHGMDWSAATKLDTKVGVHTQCTYCAVVSSWIYDIDWNSPDGQAISGGVGNASDEGPIKVYNNLLAGASETWIWGGGAARAWPHDIEIRRNVSMKPMKWMMATGASVFVGNSQTTPNIKNLGEVKHGHRVFQEDNIFMNSWEGQADETGPAVLMMPKNQSYKNTAKRVNVSGTAVSCALDAAGTPCAAHTGQWGNRITTLSRANGIVTLSGQPDGGWPYWNPGDHVRLQDIPSQVVNGVNLSSFNGEQTAGWLTATTCSDGYNTPNVLYFASAGPDFPSTATNGGLIHDFIVSTCPLNGHCGFNSPSASYPRNPVVTVIDSEHITVQQDLGTVTGATQTTCHPGRNPLAEVKDYVFRYNWITHAENVGMSIANALSDCLDPSRGVSQVSIHDNVFDDIDTTAWQRDDNACCAHGGSGIGIGNSVTDLSLQPHDITIAHNTFAGLRGWPWPIAYSSSGGLGFGDTFDVGYTGLTLQRVSNVVTITFNQLSGVAPAKQTVISGFTGSYTDLNGTWDIVQQLNTSIVFTEPGSHADISPAITMTAGTTGVAYVNFPTSYFASISWRDNIDPGPFGADNWGGHIDSRGVSGLLAVNMCDPSTHACTWTMKNNLIGTAMYTGYPQASSAPYPTVNPDTSSTCTLTGGCFVSDFSSVFTNWGGGLGNTEGNDYTVTSAYHNAASDGKDLGADIRHWKALKAALLPTFTFNPLTITTSSLTACTNGTYCEQQLLWAGGASGSNGFVQMHVTGTLPTGMKFSNGDGGSNCQVNGSYSKTGPTGCVGWLYGTPTQSGSFTLTFTAEDAAHQTATATATLTVN